jgi:hypothetical protein
LFLVRGQNCPHHPAGLAMSAATKRQREIVARTGVRAFRRRPLRYFAAVLTLRSGLRFSNYASELCSYGDSNSGPLACHGTPDRSPETATCHQRLR